MQYWSLNHSVWHMLMWSHSCTCHTTRLSTSGMSHPAFNPQLQSITALWLAFISRPMSGRRFNWPEWQVTNTELELSAIKMVTTSVLTRPDIKQLRSMLLLSHHPYNIQQNISITTVSAGRAVTDTPFSHSAFNSISAPCKMPADNRFWLQLCTVQICNRQWHPQL